MKVFVAVAFLQRRHDLLFVVTTKFVFHRNQSVLFGWLLAALAAFRFFAFLYFSALLRFLTIEQSHVGNMNRALAFGDFPAWIILRFSQVLLDNANSFDQHALLAWKYCENSSGRTTEVPGNHLDVIAFFYVMLDAIHKTSGASDTIFIKLRSRSSRATGPKIRVPRGFKSLSMITIALLSNRRREPSSRRIACRVRTRTARTTSPFFTVPVALASFTFAVMTSPIPA